MLKDVELGETPLVVLEPRGALSGLLIPHGAPFGVEALSALE